MNCQLKYEQRAYYDNTKSKYKILFSRIKNGFI